ncbi:Dabb family protein [Tateyamaria omphalii]|uniref:Stress responsive protein n=1 Tax=Tateyamaria omphalii TaxID=299262 RepID=A0A1P8MTZ4_9RHOB|nr:Dabb family protein [Tateyamaria omphalii]APX11515.1 stress responsive protein [Tateyamaria omphalii]
MSDADRLRHVVFFRARDRADVDRVFEGLSILEANPHADVISVRKNTHSDALSDQVDVVVYAEFRDARALADYKAHPLYQRSIDLVRPLRDLRVAADITF